MRREHDGRKQRAGCVFAAASPPSKQKAGAETWLTPRTHLLHPPISHPPQPPRLLRPHRPGLLDRRQRGAVLGPDLAAVLVRRHPGLVPVLVDPAMAVECERELAGN